VPGAARAGVATPGAGDDGAAASTGVLTGTAGVAVPAWGPGVSGVAATPDTADCGTTTPAVAALVDTQVGIGDPTGTAVVRATAFVVRTPGDRVAMPWLVAVPRDVAMPWAVTMPWVPCKPAVFAGPAAVLPGTGVGTTAVAALAGVASADSTAAKPAPGAEAGAGPTGVVAFGRS
jgi:hypothetical protein